jgi:hypothetical protein
MKTTQNKTKIKKQTSTIKTTKMVDIKTKINNFLWAYPRLIIYLLGFISGWIFSLIF